MIKRLGLYYREHPYLFRAGSYIAAYALWTGLFKLIVLTFLTYFLMQSQSKIQDISEAFATYELSLFGIAALLFVVILRRLHPLSSTTTDEIITLHRVEKRFFPGVAHGIILSVAVVVVFLLTGLYRYLGFYIQVQEGTLAFMGILFQGVSLCAFVYCEEFVFRHKILGYLRREMGDTQAILITAVAFCLTKLLQFELGIMHTASLFILSVLFSVRTILEGDFVRGAGIFAGLLLVFHTLLSLPILGNDFPGILLVRYEGVWDSEVFQFVGSGFKRSTARLLTGGIGGPLSGFAFQLLLVVHVVQDVLKNKKVFL